MCGNPSGTIAVGSFAPNAFGLYDMHGNVEEWCLDAYHSYGSAPQTDPFVWGGANASRRTLRSGGWGNFSNDCRAAYRDFYTPTVTNRDHGFRVVLAPVLGV